MENPHGRKIEFHDDRIPKQLSENVKVLLFHAVREVLVNIIKHAEARHASVSLSRARDTIQIDITDDGIGIEAARTSKSSFNGGGFGLFNIRERLAYLGGGLEIGSHNGGGTPVSVNGPLGGAGPSTLRKAAPVASSPQTDVHAV